MSRTIESFGPEGPHQRTVTVQEVDGRAARRGFMVTLSETSPSRVESWLADTDIEARARARRAMHCGVLIGEPAR
jgi:hypothetical protein